MNPNLTPVYLLRSYAWALIKNNTNLSEADYGGLVPIVPVAEEKELSQYTKPHLVYGYYLGATGDLPARRTGSMTFAVYSSNFRELTTLLDILYIGFGRADESAKDINEYTTAVSAQFRGIRFGYVEVGFVEGGTPEDTEDGPQSGIINITFEYYVDYNVKTKVSEFTE